jgi:hypothetical protein
MKDNFRNRPFLIAFGTIAALYGLTFAPIGEYRFLGIDLRPVTLPWSAPAAPEPVVMASAPTFSSLASLPELTAVSAATFTVSSPTGTAIPAVTLASLPTLSYLSALSASPTLSTSPTPTTRANGLFVDYGNSLQLFQQALRDQSLKDREPGMIRIAYVGDSLIEGDVITKDLRALLQGRFGGAGTGFMKIIAEDAPFRTDIKHLFSEDWTVEALNRYAARGPFWLGPVFVSGKGSWVSYEMTGKKGAALDCYLLFRGDGAAHKISVKINNDPETALDLDPVEGMHFTRINGQAENTLRKIRIFFPESGIKAYGVSFQRDRGVYVDNYSLRGHKGLELARVSPDVAGQVLRYSPYKLIILQFGVNVSYAQADGFRLYERGISGVIGHLRQLFPGTGILVVSTTDRCVKDGETIVSDSGVPELMAAQHRAAAKEGVAFFDLYHAMGGTGAMNAWVRDGYAVKDYTHISRRGGRKIADMLYGMLMEPGDK